MNADRTPAQSAESAQVSHCPACGQAGVTVGLNSVLLETRPTVRPHACGVGGPGSAAVAVRNERPIHFGYLPECPDGVDCVRPGCLDAHMWRCQHEWLDRPESDTRECLICGTEVAG